MEIGEIRSRIDKVDDKIASLYSERMGLCREIALYKEKNGVAMENTLREKEILNRVTERMPAEIKLFGKQVFTTMFDTSKAYQSRVLNAHSKIKDRIDALVVNGLKEFPIEASVACQGVEGAYSALAAERMFELSEICYFKDWGSVFTAVEKGLCQYGVLPIENSSVGSVNRVYDLMQQHRFHIVKSIKLHVRHCLLAREGTALSDVREIISHEQAVSQCSAFLKSLGNVGVTICDNTAQAAKLVAESGRDDIACFSSKECAGIYGLQTLKASVQDNDNNYTRFIAISKNLEIFEGADKISIMVDIPHEAGSLNKILNRFSTLGLNLTKLESRPIPNSMFEFAFYFDFEADVRKAEVKNLIAELENTCDNFVFLGNYSEI